jgi:protein TonB
MLAYLANRPVPGQRQSSPNALLIVISVHVALLAAVMSARMELPTRVHRDPPTQIDLIKEPLPPPVEMHARPQPQPHRSTIDQPHTEVPIGPINTQSVDGAPSIDFANLGAAGDGSMPTVEPKPTPLPIRHDARLLTPASELKPPYPASKLASEEEAALRLRLTIDENGRVVAVDPVGPADRIFLDAARRYLIAHWRYQPATEDGRAITSSMVITLRFQLDG